MGPPAARSGPAVLRGGTGEHRPGRREEGGDLVPGCRSHSRESCVAMAGSVSLLAAVTPGV